MDKWTLLFLGICFTCCAAKDPYKPLNKRLPFMVYYHSRYRGICVGVLVGRTVVLTAAVCVTDPLTNAPDKRPINVVVGSQYRHPRRGIRVQITKIILPRMVEDLAHRAYMLEKSVAILLMRKRVPDILAENPLRPIGIDWKGEQTLRLQEECYTLGWHFFYHNDSIYPVNKFLLQRNLRVQFINIVKMHEWCDALHLKLVNVMLNIGYDSTLDKNTMICTRDPDRRAQACHGMYGAPFFCGGSMAVGMLLAPDAQWTNCTGFSNIVHLFNAPELKNFFTCTSKLFVPEINDNYKDFKKAIYDEQLEEYDYVAAVYGHVVRNKSDEYSSFENEQVPT